MSAATLLGPNLVWLVNVPWNSAYICTGLKIFLGQGFCVLYFKIKGTLEKMLSEGKSIVPQKRWSFGPILTSGLGNPGVLNGHIPQPLYGHLTKINIRFYPCRYYIVIHPNSYVVINPKLKSADAPLACEKNFLNIRQMTEEPTKDRKKGKTDNYYILFASHASKKLSAGYSHK